MYLSRVPPSRKIALKRPCRALSDTAALVWSLPFESGGILDGSPLFDVPRRVIPPPSLTLHAALSMTLTVDVITSGSDASSRAPLLRPPVLRQGDTIGIVAPSYSPREDWLHRGVKALNR